MILELVGYNVPFSGRRCLTRPMLLIVVLELGVSNLVVRSSGFLRGSESCDTIASALDLECLMRSRKESLTMASGI